MEVINKFFEEMDKVMYENKDLYMNIQKLRHNGAWRIHVMGKCITRAGGDAELLYVEDSDRNTAFKCALEKIEQLKTNIKNLKEMKE